MAKLLDLPAELQVEISKYLDSKSVVALSESCKQLNAMLEREADAAKAKTAVKSLITKLQETLNDAKQARALVRAGYTASGLYRGFLEKYVKLMTNLTELQKKLKDKKYQVPEFKDVHASMTKARLISEQINDNVEAIP